VDAEVAVIGAGVVGGAAALELARRGVEVVLLEAEPEPGLQASGTNSGILHTGFDSSPGGLETELILRSAALREPVLEALGVPVLRCGAEMRPHGDGDEPPIAALAANARRTGVAVALRDDGSLEIPGESVTDPVAYTLALCGAAQRHGARLSTELSAAGIERDRGSIRVIAASGDAVSVRLVVNCAGIGAGAVARMAGDDSFDVYPRKGEFLVFDPPAGGALEHILLPVPTPRTKGVLVFPTLDGRIVAGPTAVDLDRPDWSVRAEAREEILPKASRMHPPLADAEPVFAYAGLRPAGRDVNYVIGRSRVEPALVNVAAIRSTGLTASPAIAERVASLVAAAGVAVGEPEALASGPPPAPGRAPWWRRTADRLGR
jgi:glycerol-3-phosphate dehydrogenase